MVIAKHEFLNIAHRGASGYCPENTMAAFNRAGELGIKWMECDVRLTEDNQVVVIHDQTVDRTTEGSGAVSGFKLQDLQKLDAGAWFSPEFEGEQIPTLVQLLDGLGSQCQLVVEIKDGIYFPRIIELTVSQILERGLESRVQISAFSWEVLVGVKELCPQIKTQALIAYGEEGTRGATVDGGEIPIYSDPQTLLRDASSYGVDVVCPPAAWIERSLVSILHQGGFLVRAWGVKDDASAEMLRLIEAGADGMTTNFPDRLELIFASFQNRRG